MIRSSFGNHIGDATADYSASSTGSAGFSFGGDASAGTPETQGAGPPASPSPPTLSASSVIQAGRTNPFGIMTAITGGATPSLPSKMLPFAKAVQRTSVGAPVTAAAAIAKGIRPAKPLSRGIVLAGGLIAAVGTLLAIRSVRKAKV